ncbi:MAG: hypothetical protein HYZ53_14385 [Planctomycetes bacterium]|nr:hypothetical protein [Planctomycetota bacterium]
MNALALASGPAATCADAGFWYLANLPLFTILGYDAFLGSARVAMVVLLYLPFEAAALALLGLVVAEPEHGFVLLAGLFLQARAMTNFLLLVSACLSLAFGLDGSIGSFAALWLGLLSLLPCAVVVEKATDMRPSLALLILIFVEKSANLVALTLLV